MAAELAAATDRARDRTAYAAAAGLYQQAAQLTTTWQNQASWLGEAAALALAAGHTGQAAELAKQAEQLVDEPKVLAELAQVSAAVEFELGEQRQAARLLIERATDADPDKAVAMLRTSAGYAWFSGDFASIRAAAQKLELIGRSDLMVQSMAHLVDEDCALGLPLLAEFVAREPGMGEDDAARMLTIYGGMILGDDAATLELTTAEVARCRQQGLIGALPQLLQDLAGVQMQTGRHRDAEATVAEAVEIVRDTGMHQRIARLNGVLARIAAIEGDEERCLQLTENALDAGGAVSDSTLSLLDLGAGRYDTALRRLEMARLGPGRHTAVLMAAAADQVEAAVRLGQPERAEQPLRRLEAWAQAGRQPWTRAVALRCRALLSADKEHYAQSVRLHEQGEGHSSAPAPSCSTVSGCGGLTAVATLGFRCGRR